MNRMLCSAMAIVLSAAAFVPAEAMAQVGVNIVIGNPPPPPRYEAAPAPRRGFVWVPGYWNQAGRKHVWMNGHWERARSGYTYRQAEWKQARGGWYLERGGWQRRDHDGDGVPNRFDRRPHNPYRS